MTSASIYAPEKCFDVEIDVDQVVNRSEALIVTGRHDRALSMLGDALARVPESGHLLGQYSRALAAAGQAPAALKAARRAVEVGPGEPLFWHRLSVSLAGCDDLPGAESAARHGLEIAGGDWAAGLNLVACTLVDQGGEARLLEAERLMQKAVELSPEDADYRYLLANISTARGNAHESNRQLSAGLALDPHHLRLLMMRGTDPSREPDGRIRSLLQVLQLDPREAEAQDALEREFFRIRVCRQMFWWLLGVFEAFLMMWNPQVSVPILSVFAWSVLIPVAWVNRATRKSLPKKYSRRMARKYPAATWAGRVAIMAVACTPFVTFALYDDHGTVLGNLVVSTLLVTSALAYAAYRHLVIRARQKSLGIIGNHPSVVSDLLGDYSIEVGSTSLFVIVGGSVLAWHGFGGPQPAASGILLLASSIGCAWWWLPWSIHHPPLKLLKENKIPWGPFWFVSSVPLLLLVMIVAGVFVLASESFVLIPT